MNSTQNNATTNLLEIDVGRELGLTSKIFLQEKARSLGGYNQKILCDDYGIDNAGNKIRVDTVGRWLFGVPGCSGHIRVMANGKSLRVYYPASIGQTLSEFLLELKNSIES